MSDASLNGRVAVVTGGGSGIGYAITKALVDKGCKVVITGRNEGRLHAAAESIGKAVETCAADVGNPDQVRQVFDLVKKRYDCLDILMNNAGVFPLVDIATVTDETLRGLVSTNVLGPLHCTREAVKLMRESGGGDIVNISSESVMYPVPLLGTYSGTKSMLETVSRELRQELKRDNIRVSILRSGTVHTQSESSGGWDEELLAKWMERTAKTGFHEISGTGIQPETTAGAVVSIVSQPEGAIFDVVELRSL
ncbi:MAG: SDR family NAD(P)-dependent oxidoreductase [Gammaproteobacteria bacterium]|nr:SDR family NAD(P)-dependent oxidoreductase [Gammaproteobacteria bacterium]